jgi:hypothetical protein
MTRPLLPYPLYSLRKQRQNPANLTGILQRTSTIQPGGQVVGRLSKAVFDGLGGRRAFQSRLRRARKPVRPDIFDLADHWVIRRGGGILSFGQIERRNLAGMGEIGRFSDTSGLSGCPRQPYLRRGYPRSRGLWPTPRPRGVPAASGFGRRQTANRGPAA